MDFNFQEQIQKKSNDELAEVCINLMKYQPAFVELATAELARRNVPLSAIGALRVKAATIEEDTVAHGKTGNPLWMGLCAVAALGGGVAGIVGGYIYAYSKQKGPSGRSYFTYNESTRKWGQIIFFASLIILVLFVLRPFS